MIRQLSFQHPVYRYPWHIAFLMLSPLLGSPLCANNLTLQEAIHRSLAMSPALDIQAAEIERREGVADQASGAFDWITQSSTTLEGTNTPLPNPPGGINTNPTEEIRRTSASIQSTRQLRNGVIIQPSAGVVTDDVKVGNRPSFGSSEVKLKILVPLLRGLGEESSGAQEAAARGDIEVAQLLYEFALSTQAFNITANYWSTRANEQILELQREVEADAASLVESTQGLVDAAVFPPIYVLQAEANLRDKRSQRINAELAFTRARFALGRLLFNDPFAIAATASPSDSFPAPEARSQSLGQAHYRVMIQRALNQRADYQAAEKSLVPLNILTRKAELDRRPKLDVFASAGYRGGDDNGSILSPFTNRTTGGNFAVGLDVEWPFKNSSRAGVLRTRRADLTRAEAEQADLALIISSDVLTAIERIRLKAEAVTAAEETVSIAREALDAQYELLKSGEGSILDTINLEEILTGSRVRETLTRADYAIALAQIRFVLGEFFEGPATNLSVSDITTLPAL